MKLALALSMLFGCLVICAEGQEMHSSLRALTLSGGTKREPDKETMVADFDPYSGRERERAESGDDRKRDGMGHGGGGSKRDGMRPHSGGGSESGSGSRSESRSAGMGRHGGSSGHGGGGTKRGYYGGHKSK
uniref:Secreted protein n=1 Tax=Grammatophora oceanica TaxID=210454 RepID=A0A7S1YJ50_9STRA